MEIRPQISQKAQDIAFAVLRVAAYIRRKELRQILERLSYELLENVHIGSAVAINTAITLNSFIKLGHHLLAIEPVNAKILEREINYLLNDIKESSGNFPLPDLETMFSKQNNPEVHMRVKEKNPQDAQHVRIRQSDNNSAKKDKVDFEAAIIRQDRIISIMRQKESGKIQLKDLIAELPGISERTIRYDLRSLAEARLIERQGSGGPSNYYVLKQTLSTDVTN